MTKDIAKKESTELAMPAFLQKDVVRGSEEVGMDDITIPRIGLIQDLSPQIKKTKPEYIEGAEVGMFYNNVTKELYGKDMTIIPVYCKKEWVVWKLRKHGGGFVGAAPTEQEAVQLLKESGEAADQCEIIDTHQHFVLVLGGDGNWTEAVISLQKGSSGASRQFNSMVKMADRKSVV